MTYNPPDVHSLPRDRAFNAWRDQSLVWLPEHGMGFYPVVPAAYDAAYFDKYQGYAATDMGSAITEARVGFVKHWHDGGIVDVGIGCGDFVQRHGNARGYDINPAGVTWLKQSDRWCDITAERVDALCFWDSLEHIPRPADAVAAARRYVFVSLPIFRDAAHVLASKHFRKDEHYWYWTHEGFVRWMAAQGFWLLQHENFESDLGRDGIGSYAFERVA